MDIRHYYQEKGEGEALILLHGNGENSDYFSDQIEEFSKYYHVYALDTRGHGRTPRGDQPFTIRQFAQDLLEFMDEHQIQQAHLLGFSDGGNIALVFALEYPERIHKLILNGANLDAHGVKWSVQFPIEIGYRIAKLFAKRSDSARQNMGMLGLMVNDPNLSPEEISRIQLPTLVIAGTKDMIKDSHTRLIAHSIPNARLEIIEGDHFVANKESKAFNAKVLAFLQSKD